MGRGVDQERKVETPERAFTKLRRLCAKDIVEVDDENGANSF